jgi:ribose-phosphate pyrophosphokinase
LTIKLFAGTSNPLLAAKIAQHLQIPLAQAFIGQFKDGETRVEINEAVHQADVFILQSTSNPADHHLMELLLMADALRQAGAKQINAIIPYFGYARQNQQKKGVQTPISAKVVADLLTAVGIKRVITVDVHGDQVQKFFSIDFKNCLASKIFLDNILPQKYPNLAIVSPDKGGVLRARTFAQLISTNHLVIIDKQRPAPNETQIVSMVGEVKDCHCIIIDDIIDTGKTICLAAMALKERGAKKITAYVTHPVLSNHAIATIESSGLDELFVTDTIPLTAAAQSCAIIHQQSVASLLADAIQSVAN